MGMETIELVMDLEDHFKISIADEDASRVQTVGELCELVLRCAREERGELTLSDAAVFEWVKKRVVRKYGVKPDQVRRDSKFYSDLGLG